MLPTDSERIRNHLFGFILIQTAFYGFRWIQLCFRKIQTDSGLIKKLRFMRAGHKIKGSNWRPLTAWADQEVGTGHFSYKSIKSRTAGYIHLHDITLSFTHEWTMQKCFGFLPVFFFLLFNTSKKFPKCRNFFPNSSQGPFPKIAGKGPVSSQLHGRRLTRMPVFSCCESFEKSNTKIH